MIEIKQDRTFTWEELSDILRKAWVLMPEETIEGLTLVKPRKILFRTKDRRAKKESKDERDKV